MTLSSSDNELKSLNSAGEWKHCRDSKNARGIDNVYCRKNSLLSGLQTGTFARQGKAGCNIFYNTRIFE